MNRNVNRRRWNRSPRSPRAKFLALQTQRNEQKKHERTFSFDNKIRVENHRKSCQCEIYESEILCVVFNFLWSKFRVYSFCERVYAFSRIACLVQTHVSVVNKSISFLQIMQIASVFITITAVNAGQTELAKNWANWSNATNRDLTFTFPDINPYGCWCYSHLIRGDLILL